MVSLVNLTTQNERRFLQAKVTRPGFDAVAQRLCDPGAKAQFQALASAVGGKVPWWVIAVIKERESGPDPQWSRNIANGQAWNRETTIVPKGRGPFRSWQEAGIDALVRCGPYAARWCDWTAGGTFTLLEQYNGLGYAARGMASPYIWSGTNQYVSGKYVADGKFDPEKVDSQLGCAGILLAMARIDPSIQFVVPSAATSLAPSVVHNGPTAGTAVAPSVLAQPKQPTLLERIFHHA